MALQSMLQRHSIFISSSLFGLLVSCILSNTIVCLWILCLAVVDASSCGCRYFVLRLWMLHLAVVNVLSCGDVFFYVHTII